MLPAKQSEMDFSSHVPFPCSSFRKVPAMHTHKGERDNSRKLCFQPMIVHWKVYPGPIYFCWSAINIESTILSLVGTEILCIYYR